MDVKEKVAIITGGASGLGLGTARRLVDKGAKVVIFDLNEERAKEVCKELGENIAYAPVDVTSKESVEAGIKKAIETYGAINMCVNCAGIAPPQQVIGRTGAMT